jgi:hypothetical protein
MLSRLIDGDDQRFNVCMVAGTRSRDASFRGGLYRGKSKGSPGPDAKLLTCLHCQHVFHCSVKNKSLFGHHCAIFSTYSRTGRKRLNHTYMSLKKRFKHCHDDPIHHDGDVCMVEVFPLEDDLACTCGTCMARFETVAQYAKRTRGERGMEDYEVELESDDQNANGDVEDYL